MTIATVLALIDGLPGSETTLKAALSVGQAFDANVELLHVSVPPESAIPMVGEGMTGAVIEEIMESAKLNAEQRGKAARGLFDKHCVDAGLALIEAGAAPESGRFTVAWRQVTGIESEEVAQRGKFFDLTVLARPAIGLDGRFSDSLESAIFDSGRPVLAVPDGTSGPVGGSVAIAWSGTREAARGVWAAKPFLGKASAVTLLSVQEDKQSADLADLKRYLGFHGVTADLRSLEPDGRPTGEHLLDEAREAGADLLVMGAYGHSRLRELVLGGVTRNVLEKAEIPVLMAH